MKSSKPEPTQKDLERYAINSGVAPLVDSNLLMQLGRDGLFHAIPLEVGDAVVSSDSKVLLVDAMSDQSLNESELGELAFGSVPGIQRDDVIGYYLGLYAGHVAEGDYRHYASSGGATTWILVQLLERGLVDGVIHVKTSSPESPLLFEYAISRTVEEIREGAKSRYYPGEVSTTLQKIKASGGRYAITGIPSILTELRLLAREDKVLGESLAYFVGLICGHQKSTKYTEAMAWQHGIKPGDLKAVDYRVKNESAPASRYLISLEGLKDGQPVTLTKSQLDFFVGNWGHGFFKPRFSDYTDDVFNETADVAMGDAWLQPYVQDGLGTNVVIVRNPEIQQIFDEGIESGALVMDSLSPDAMRSSQKGLIHHNQDEIGYRLHREDKRGNWRPAKRFPADDSLPFLRKRVQDVREKISARSHTEYTKALEKGDWQSFEKAMKPLVLQYRFWYLCIAIRSGSVGSILRAALNRAKNKLR